MSDERRYGGYPLSYLRGWDVNSNETAIIADLVAEIDHLTAGAALPCGHPKPFLLRQESPESTRCIFAYHWCSRCGALGTQPLEGHEVAWKRPGSLFREADHLRAEVSRLEGEVARLRMADVEARMVDTKRGVYGIGADGGVDIAVELKSSAPIFSRRLVRQPDGAYFYEHTPAGAKTQKTPRAVVS